MKHAAGRLVTASGRQLDSVRELIQHLRREGDGLPTMLAQACTALDPPADTPQHVPPADDAPSPFDIVQAEFHGALLPRASVSLKRQIGAGHFGQVFLATLTTKANTRVAVKVCRDTDSPRALEAFAAEARVLRSFSHPNITRLLGMVTEGCVWMVLEHVCYGDLHRVLRRMRSQALKAGGAEAVARALLPQECLFMATQVASALGYLHARGFIHRDLAARNILLGRMCRVKVCRQALVFGGYIAFWLTLSAPLHTDGRLWPLAGCHPRPW